MASYTEQATFKVIDQASGPVKAITTALTALDKAAKQLAKGYNLGASLRGLDAATKNLTQSTREIDKLTRSFDKLGKINLNLTGATNQITSMADAMRRLNAEVVRSDRLRGATRGMVGGSGGGVVQQTAAADRFNRWMQARETRMAHNDARFLGRHAAAAMGVDYHAAASGVHAAEMFPRRPGLVMGVLGGAAAVAGAKTTMEVAGSRDLVLKQLKALGYDKEIEGHGGHHVNGLLAAKEQAHAISRRYLNVSETDALDMIKEGTSLFGDQGHAIEGAQHLARMTSFLNTYMGEHAGGDFRRESFAAVKSAEIAGKITPESMKKYMEGMTAMKIVYGEQANFQTFLAAQRAAGIAGMGLSDEYRFGIMPAMVQEFGPGAGVMLATAFRHAHGNKKFTKKELAQMSTYGVFDAKNDATTYKDKFDKNPFEAALELGNRIAAKKGFAPLVGVDGKFNAETHEKVKPLLADIIGRMLGDRNAAKQMVEQLFQAPKLIKDAKLLEAVQKDMDNIAKGDFFNMRTMPGMQTALQKQWENFLSKLGEDMASPLIGVGNKVAGMMNRASDLPAPVKVAGVAAGAVGAAYAGKKVMEWITGSGQMKLAANAHLRAAAALSAAAGRLGLGGAAGMAGGLAGGAKPSKLGRVMKGGGLLGLAALTAYELYDLLPDDMKAGARSLVTPIKRGSKDDNTDFFASAPSAGWFPKAIEDALAKLNNPTMKVGPGEGEEFRRFMDMDHNLDHLSNRVEAEETGKVVASSFGKSTPKVAKVFSNIFGEDVPNAGALFTRAFRDGAPLAGDELSTAFGTGVVGASNELTEAISAGGDSASAAIADSGSIIGGQVTSSFTDGSVAAADILIGGISSGADQAAGSLSAGVVGGGAEAGGIMQSSIAAAAGTLQSAVAAGGEQAAASIAAALANGVSVNINPGKTPDVGSNGMHY
jgi:disulfide oxidoreductase YuzD